ncbi:carboxymuconolactone decarboxylase family protein [Singulisphaera sp. PoT]|uniref:carboxymuconolactone decarboxylase family protein n=1 Tax=Singulisphaera sp. PoT TaxID=3411797 RepID=UPI003BF54201
MCSLLVLGGSGLGFGAEESTAKDVPPVIAGTRDELKQQLEDSKQSHPRLPLPAPTEQDIAEAKARAAEAKTKASTKSSRPTASGLGGGIVNNGRMRKIYLPAEFSVPGFSREPDPSLTVDDTFKVMFFWIVSRINNCTYCQGHQEVKLSAAGVKEDTIAALDYDWNEFTPAERAAFAFTVKLSKEPQEITGADIDRLRSYYKDTQIIEIITAVAGFNCMNRWTGPLAIPQEPHRIYLTKTADKFQGKKSLVAPLDPAATSLACAKPFDRGPLESRSEVEAALSACKARTPRLPLADEAQTRSVLPADWTVSGAVPQWARLLANFPKAGKSSIASTYYSQVKGKLDPKLRAEIAWVAARNDRAWYALGHARRRLHELGLNDDAIFKLDQPDDSVPAPERKVLALAKKITVNPALVTDADIEGLRKTFSDHEVAEIVHQTTMAAFFDRLTEAAGLALEN